MTLLDVNWNPSRRELRWLAVLQFVGLALLAHAVSRHGGGRHLGLAILAISAALGVAGLLAPPVMRVVYVTWMTLVFPLGWLVSHLILAVIFYLVVAPIGLLMRLVGRDPLERKFDRRASSYWTPRPPPRDSDGYFKQF